MADEPQLNSEHVEADLSRSPSGSPSEDGSSKVQISLDLSPGETIRLTIEALPSSNGHVTVLVKKVRTRTWQPDWRRISQSLAGSLSRLVNNRLAIGSRVITLEELLFGLVILVYLSTRLIGIDRFPIYFFTDEAIQTVQAANFVQNGLRGPDHELFPTYFESGNQYEMSLSVYIQVIPYIIFGKSEVATRATAMLSTVLGAVCIGLILRNIFKQKYWWAGSLILSIVPAWFLHTRTAFEAALMVSMYTAFIYFYLRYRYIAPKNIYLSLVFGALAFYSSSPGSVVVVATGVLLLISDSRYHWQHRKMGFIGLGVLAVLALPYARFYIEHKTSNYQQLQILGSYWTDPMPFIEKLRRYFVDYISGLSPVYWFSPNAVDIPRHLMKGYGRFLWPTFPFTVLGLGICIKNIRSSMHRVILIALLASPTGAALVGLGITRLMVFVLPATLLITLGVTACLRWLEKHRLSEKALAFGLFIPLVAFNFYMLNDSLVNGPLWYRDYGLYGMQYGARQIFSAIQEYLKQSPETHILLSPSWTNGTDVVEQFFLPDPGSIALGSIQSYLVEHLPIDDNTLFIMIPDEFKEMEASNKFTDIKIEKTLPYPDGTHGFYFVRLHYVENIDAILKTEKEERSIPQQGEVSINGQQVHVSYSLLDSGTIANAFDGNPDTLMRTMEANPLVLDLTFPQSQTMSGMTVIAGGAATRITARVLVAGQNTPQVFQEEQPQTTELKHMTFQFNTALQVISVHLEVLSVNDGEPGHVHVWEITFK